MPLSQDSDDIEMVRTAHHEAGHAVLQLVLGLGMKHVTIVPDEEVGTAGCSMHGGYGEQGSQIGEDDDDVAQLRLFAEEAFHMRHGISVLAGAEATRRLDPNRDDWRNGADDDYKLFACHLDDLGLDDASFRHLNAYLHARTEALVQHYWPEITALAAALLVSQTIEGDHARAVILDSLKNRGGGLRSW